MHASVSILAAPQTNRLECPLLHKAEVEVSPEPPVSLSPLVGTGQWCSFSLHLLTLVLITHVIRSGCHGNRQCSSVHSGGFVLSLDYSKCFMHSICVAQDRWETSLFQLHLLSVIWTEDTWMRLLSTLIKEINKQFLLGAVCKCLSPDSQRSLTILRVFIVNRSTSIWYLLETFQSWLSNISFAVWCPWPCRHLTLSNVNVLIL